MKNKNILRSFKIALRGIGEILRTEPTFKYMLIGFAAVIVAIVYFKPTRAESAVLVFIAIAVLMAELVNSLIERLLNIIQPNHDERVRHIKDVMAGVVLIVSIGAALIGAIILLPYFMQLLSN